MTQVRGGAYATPSGRASREPVQLAGDGEADARVCARITRAHARTFALASRFLPATKRRAAFALYAFCRQADDLVDSADDSTPAGRGATSARLASYGRELDAALDGEPRGPVFRELARFVTAYRVPPEVLRELLAGVARDLEPVRYATWVELGRYCEGVASTVGEMCTHVFGVPGGAPARERALRYARTLGVAMQLTNILRDIGEDARRGRCYLPEDEVATVGLSRNRILEAGQRRDGSLARDPNWRRLLCFQVARARALYAAAQPGIALLAPDAQRCATACATGYAAILDAIEARDYDTLSGRARVGNWGRATILWEAWRVGRPGAATPPDDGPVPTWDRAVHALPPLSRTIA